MRREFLYLPVFVFVLYLSDFMFLKITGSRDFYYLLKIPMYLSTGLFIGFDRPRVKATGKVDKVRLFAVVVPLAFLMFICLSMYAPFWRYLPPYFDLPNLLINIISIPLLLELGLILLGYFTVTLKR